MPGKSIFAVMRKRGLWPLTVAGALAILVGAGFHHLAEIWSSFWWDLVAGFVLELGMAFVIAVILFLIFEDSASKRHMKSVLAILYHINPETKYFNIIEKYIIKSPFYRKNTHIKYEIIDKSEDRILVKMEISYEVHNVSDGARFYSGEGAADLRPLNMCDRTWENRGDEDCGLGLKRIEIDGKEAGFNPVQETTPSFVETHTLKKRVKVAAEGHINVLKRYVIEKRLRDSEVWQAVIPSDGVTIEMISPVEYDLEFAATAIHPDSDKLRLSPARGSKQSGRLSIGLHAPMLSGFGVHVWWSPEEATTAPSVQA